MAGLGLTDRAEHPDFLRKHQACAGASGSAGVGGGASAGGASSGPGALRPDIQYYLKASFNALRKIHKNAESGQLESIIQTVTQRASNVGNKKLLDLPSQTVPISEGKSENIIEDFFLLASPGKQRRQELETALETKVVKKSKKTEGKTRTLF